MATLILSTVGTALGGPVGGAIGSLIGQGIDQQLLGSGPRRGPRLGDLSVQTSSYGALIPKVFGRMRIAGNIVWSTDLIENSTTQTAKNAPDTIGYAYSISLAVALSSRPIKAVGRIWADGNLIRTAEGEFTVETDFRVWDGAADQAIDPLIGSIEGIESTPAYRGLALAVFDGLQLSSFGNRIPFFTFEVIADEGDVTVASVLSEASGGIIQAPSDRSLAGFAAYGDTIAAAIEPVVNAFNISLADNGRTIDGGASEIVAYDPGDAGCSADGRQAPRVERSQLPVAKLPSTLAFAYYDTHRDYQQGIARAAMEIAGHSTERVDLPAVLDVSAAKGLAEGTLSRRWSERDRMTVRLPQSYLSLRPGARLLSPQIGEVWTARRVTLESMAVVVELSPASDEAPPMAGDAGRIIPSNPALPAPTSILLAELPDDGNGSGNKPIVAIAAVGSAGTTRLQVEVGASTFFVAAAPAGPIAGRALSKLEGGQSALVDLASSVEIQLSDDRGWLESCDLDALAAGKNLALLGDELLQFGTVVPLGGGAFRMTRLLRGRAGSEWAMSGHSVGEQFTLIDPLRLEFLALGAGQIGATVRVTPCGLADSDAEAVEMNVSGEALRPPTPCHVNARFEADLGLACTWVRRSRTGWQWLDGVDATLGCSTELYRATLSGTEGSIFTETTAPSCRFEAGQIDALGAGSLQLSVVQVGDFAVSRPAITTVARS